MEAYGVMGAKGVLEDPVMKRVAKKHRKTTAQVSIKFALQEGLVVLAKSNTPARVSENADVFDWSLDGADLEALRGLDRADGLGRSYWDNPRVP